MTRYRFALPSVVRILCEAAWDDEAVPWHLTIRPLQVYLSALEYIHKLVFHRNEKHPFRCNDSKRTVLCLLQFCDLPAYHKTHSLNNRTREALVAGT
jgi:hypothetical protein